MVLDLNNGFKFIKKDSNDKAIFFGANRVGKTQISNTLGLYYDSKEEQYLLFNDNIMDRMVLPDGKEKVITVFPKIEELNKLEREKKQVGEKLAVKKLLKKQYGVDTQKAFKFVDGLDTCIKNDIYNIEKQVKKQVYDTEVIIELISPTEGKIMNFFEILDSIDTILKFTNKEQLELMTSADVYKIQKSIIDDSLESCPVCYSDITDEKRKQIKKAIESGAIDEQLKKSILYYLNSKVPMVAGIMERFIISPNKNEEKLQIINNTSNDICHYISNNISIENIKKYNDYIKSIFELKTSVSKFTLNEKTDGSEIEYVKNKLKEHSCCKNITSVEIVSGELKITGSDVEYNNMSTSEKNLFKFIYFDVLVRQKIKQGNLHIVVDDPFDSYDDAYVNDIILIILKLIKTYEDTLNDVYIFSHSIYVLKLYNEANSDYYNINIDIRWLDVFDGDDIIYSFNDKYMIVEKLDENPGDYGMAIKVKDKFKDRYSLIMAASILKTELLMNKILFNNASATSICSTLPLIYDLYDTICDCVNHTRGDTTITNLSQKLNLIYGFDLISDDENINKVLDDVDNNDYTKIEVKSITCSKNVIKVPVSDISHLFTWKYLLSLKLRRGLELLVRAQLNNTVNFRELGDLIGSLGTSSNEMLIKDFYEKNRELLNSFNHSSARFIPPILVYRSKDIQDCYKGLDELKSKIELAKLQTV